MDVNINYLYIKVLYERICIFVKKNLICNFKVY